MNGARFHLAWLMWCYREDYLNPIDREGMTNWMLDDPSTLVEEDAIEREELLAMAVEILAEIEPSSAHSLIEDGRLVAEWLGRAVNGPPFGMNVHPLYGYRLPGDVADAMRRLTGSHDEQIEER
jgi:hypothetical protein